MNLEKMNLLSLPRYCEADRCSAGRHISLMPASTKPHLKVGAQKWMVLGPAGWLMKAFHPPAQLKVIFELLQGLVKIN